MHFRYILLCCGFVVFLGSCKTSSSPSDTQSDPTTIEQLFPLAYGNYWIYDEKVFNEDGTLQEESSQTAEVNGTQTVLGHPGFIIDFGTGNQLLYYSGTDLLSAPQDSTSLQTGFQLRYPMAIGQTIITSDTTITFGDSLFFESIHQKQQLAFRGKYESVTVPLSTYSCYHYEQTSINNTNYNGQQNNDTSSAHLYLAPGIGMVKEMVTGKDSAGKSFILATLELTSYHVK